MDCGEKRAGDNDRPPRRKSRTTNPHLHRSTKCEFFSDGRTKNDDDDHRNLQHHVWRIAQKIKGGMPLHWRLNTSEIKLDRRNNAADRLQWKPCDQQN